MVELTADGKRIDLPSDAKIKYTKRIGDIFDIASVVSSYTNSFKGLKTPNNTANFEGLGLVGDSSSIPYRKISANLSSDGASVIPAGWLSIKKTGDDYDLSIIDGMIDFFKAIENKTLGKDLDLSDFAHEKNLETVINSFTNDFYRYLVADYNGKTKTISGSDTVINVDYLVPCFSVMKLLDVVMYTFGYTYSTANLQDLSGLYITYPKDPASTSSIEPVAELSKGLYVSSNKSIEGSRYVSNSFMPWTTTNVVEGTMSGNNYVAPESGIYQIDFDIQGYLFAGGGLFPNSYYAISLSININGTETFLFTGSDDTEEPASGSITRTLNEGDVVSFKIIRLGLLYQSIITFHHHHTDIVISKTNQGVIDFTDAFADYSIKDFFKELVWFTGTTPVIEGNNIRFLTIKDRISLEGSQDLSDSFVARKSEEYLPDGYAQKNTFRHKYQDENRKDQDGYIEVNNANIPDEKVVAASKIYAPEMTFETFESQESLNFRTRKFRIWDTEAKENSEGETEITYKGLTGRFFFIREKASPSGNWKFGSDLVTDTGTVSGTIPTGDNFRTTYSQIVPEKYAEMTQLLNNFRKMDFELALSVQQFLKIDITKCVYFAKEAAYFLINQITFQEGGLSQMEAIKINRQLATAPEEPVNETLVFTLRATSNRRLLIFIPIVHGLDDMDVANSEVILNYGSIGTISDVQVVGNVLQFTVRPPVESLIPDGLLFESMSIRLSNGTYSADIVCESPIGFLYIDFEQEIYKTLTAEIINI